MMIYEAEIPEEPPIGTVVLDKDGTAWQRISTAQPYPCWVPARLNHNFDYVVANYWPKLLTELGPLLELYRPEETP